ncbi:MAG: HAD family hydrolase [Suilimivivens sp.]
MKYKQIVFDVDGTLMNNEFAVLCSFQDTIREVTGKTMEMEELKFCLGIPGESAISQLGIEDTSGTLELWVRKLAKYEDTVRVFEGIPELLERLKKAGYKMGIVTSRTRELQDEDFKNRSIRTYFETVVCADECITPKPTAGPLLKYMELTGTECRELLYIGDSIYDLECAENAGVDFALAGWGSSNHHIQAERIVKMPEELFCYLNV